MVKLEIDLSLCLKLNITPNQYTIAYLLHNGHIEDLEIFRENIYRNDLFFKEDIINLVNKRYIKEDIDFVKTNGLRNCNIQNIFESTKTKYDESWDEFVDKFRDEFPSGIISGGQYIRSSKKDCSKKLAKFVKDYPQYTREMILEATKAYIKRCSLQGYKYMKLATYFISKDDVSTLASECEALSNNKNKPSSGILSSGI